MANIALFIVGVYLIATGAAVWCGVIVIVGAVIHEFV